eukprot:CAMPEP_0183309904 /NCGR_PEP_ID=MMETSP0160_2-20130417/26911_1 /TAXON_ID=2839 ORGANISM="Odontella Sinensis, Strain Grunow 1884" /NCGR_SAMPLE_ID=MMETSP0160_2 /ASSEMBLY_ACC=CAM_ASM_000250 /LENGTH=126 /DNA_ID=CAMNT_0025474009 /DNA_START=318 /DNA_END=694 /DNA_ORIENTATION=-
MTEDSIWHAIDRSAAFPMTVLELLKILCIIWHQPRRLGTVAYVVSFAGAVFSFLKSQDAQDRVDPQEFVFWHNMWHLYPLACIFITYCDRNLMGEPEAGPAPIDLVRKSARPKLLSDVVMEHTNSA